MSTQNPESQQVPAQKVSQLYCNAFGISLSNSDMSVLFQLNNIPFAEVHMSYTTAKTLGMKLNDAIKELEVRVGQSILTIEQTGKSLNIQVSQKSDEKSV